MIFKVFFEFKNKESAPRKLDVNLTHYSKYFIYFFYKTVKTFFNITKSFSVSFYILVFLLSSLGFFYNPIETFAYSGVPTILSYQGRLTDGAGDLVGGSGTSYYFKFSIWTTFATTTGSRLWPTSSPTSFTSTVRQGIFNINIGDTVNGYPDTLDYNFNTNNTIFLQIEVSSNGSTFETLSPRQQISATAFAELTAKVSGIGQSSFGTTTPILNSVVTVEATSTSAIPISVRAFVGQVASLFRIEDSSLNHLFSINSLGGIFASSTLN